MGVSIYITILGKIILKKRYILFNFDLSVISYRNFFCLFFSEVLTRRPKKILQNIIQKCILFFLESFMKILNSRIGWYLFWGFTLINRTRYHIKAFFEEQTHH